MLFRITYRWDGEDKTVNVDSWPTVPVARQAAMFKELEIGESKDMANLPKDFKILKWESVTVETHRD